ncbi:DUF6148 family protein [Variovorax sp. UC122_21]|uniref:DUF6148 family protein n=1 Tax=Variovorax sp. UC122_21 TaxID=3374554 RepID=UPI0037578A22
MTEAELTARLAAYLAAETAILTGAQEYTVGAGSTARRLTRANLGEVQQAIKEIRSELSVLQAGKRGRRVVYLRPL